MIRLLAVIEATTVTGPAKNLLEFCKIARQPEDGGVGIDVSLVTFHREDGRVLKEGEPENEFVATARAAGIHINVLPERKRFDTQVIEMLREVAKERKPDIVQTHAVKSHWVMRKSGLWRTYPWVAWHHAYTTTDFKMRCYNQLDRWSLRVPKLVMTVNRPFITDLEKIGVPSNRLRMLHNAARIGWNAHVTNEDVQKLKEKWNIQDDEKVILAVGRFSLEKAQIDLLNAFSELKRLHPTLKLRLVLVGSGPEKENLQSACAQLGITNQVVFVGQVSDVGPYFKMADVMALPSHGEGSPNVLLEAITAGLPIVSTTVGGIPEMVVNRESAMLIEPRDIKGMARSLGEVLTNENLAQKLASNGLIVAERYSPEVRLKALLEIYRGLVKEPLKP
jgi:glycosyltransferase involved in cell wall biosynthesis